MTRARERSFGLAGAIRFLTRVPVPGRGTEADDLARSVPWFPVVGAMVGALVAAVYAAGLQIWPAPVAAVVAIVAGLALTGAFHEDGLADTADALGAGASHTSPAEALRIMRDPTLGSYGVLALVVSVAMRVLALAVLDAAGAVAVMVGAHSLARGAAVSAMSARTATSDGLGAAHARRVGGREIGLALAAALILSVAAMGAWGLAAAAVAALATVAITHRARRMLGGITGDILGAVEQVTEVLILLGAAAIAHNGWGDLAWWFGR